MAAGCVWRRSCRSHHRQLVVLVIVSVVLSLGWGGGSNGGGGGRGTGWVALADEATATPSASSDDSGKADGDGEATITADGTAAAAAAAEPVQHAPSAALCATPSRANNIDKCQATQRCAWVVGVGCVKAHFASQGMPCPDTLAPVDDASPQPSSTTAWVMASACQLGYTNQVLGHIGLVDYLAHTLLPDLLARGKQLVSKQAAHQTHQLDRGITPPPHTHIRWL